MKKFTLIFITFFTFLQVSATWYDGKILMKNGTEKVGLIQGIEAEDSKVKFKLNKDAEKEKIDAELIAKVYFKRDDGSSFNEFVYLKSGMFKNKKGELKVWNDKYWMMVIKGEGKFQIFEARSSMFTVGLNKSSTFTTFIKKENEEIAIYLSMEMGVLSTTLFKDSSLRKILTMFGKDCPKFIELVNSKDNRVNNLLDIAKEYDNFCN